MNQNRIDSKNFTDQGSALHAENTSNYGVTKRAVNK